MRHLARHPCSTLVVSLLLLLGIGGCEEPSAVPLPIEQVTIEMTGHDFKWHSRYAGIDEQLGTEDDIEAAQVLHVPVDSRIEILLKSRDFLYSLEVPQARRKEIAVPELTFSLSFDTDTIGTFEMPGGQMCGYSHPDLIGTLIVESQSDYARWLTSQQ